MSLAVWLGSARKCSAAVVGFYYHLYLLSRSDQQLIQRIPAGLSSTVFA